MIFNTHYTRRRSGFLFEIYPDSHPVIEGFVACIGSGKIDWGDGTTTIFTPEQPAVTHPYEYLAWYQIQITADSMELFRLSNFRTNPHPYQGGVRIHDPLPADIFGGLEDFTRCFAQLGVYGDIYVPSDLFINCTGAKNFYECFMLSRILQIPDLRYCTGIENLEFCFWGCEYATGEAPPLWEVFDDVPHKGCFTYCTNLSNYDEIPDDWKK